MTVARPPRMTLEEITAKMEKDKEERNAAIFQLIENNKMLDEDGYPTQAAHDVIKLWHWSNPVGWFSFIESLWAMKSFGWSEGETEHDYIKDKKVYIYELSTAGWSGNEGLIRAMEENRDMWDMVWVQSRRGGHYIFELRDYAEED